MQKPAVDKGDLIQDRTHLAHLDRLLGGPPRKKTHLTRFIESLHTDNITKSCLLEEHKSLSY